MNITVNFIRNAITRGGLEGRFLGRLDEPLDPKGEQDVKKRLAEGVYPPCELLFCSPMARCVDTARLIYPKTPAIVMKELSALDYGDFTGQTYSDIVGDQQFRDWAWSDKLEAYPGGEEPHAFLIRCAKAYRGIIGEARKKQAGQVSIVTHLSVMQALLERFYLPRSYYRDWQADYGGGYTVICGESGESFTVSDKF